MCVWGALLLNGGGVSLRGAALAPDPASGILLWAVFPFSSYYAPGLVPDVVGTARGSQTGNMP